MVGSRLHVAPACGGVSPSTTYYLPFYASRRLPAEFGLGNNRGTQAGERERVVDDEAHDEGPEHGRTVGFHEPLRRSGNFVQNADEKSDGPGDVPGPVDAQPRPRPFLPRQDVIGGHGAANRAEGRADDLEENDQVLRHARDGEEGADGYTHQRGDSLGNLGQHRAEAVRGDEGAEAGGGQRSGGEEKE